MSKQEYRELLAKTVDSLKTEGYSEMSINLAIINQRIAPSSLKQRKEIITLRDAIKTVSV